jgi:hypothetical protein
MAANEPERQPINVVLPPEPPNLTPGAARALLRILVKAYEKQAADEDSSFAVTRRLRRRPGRSHAIGQGLADLW